MYPLVNLGSIHVLLMIINSILLNCTILHDVLYIYSRVRAWCYSHDRLPRFLVSLRLITTPPFVEHNFPGGERNNV